VSSSQQKEQGLRRLCGFRYLMRVKCVAIELSLAIVPHDLKS
jgi:hypothetical protein